MPCWVLFVLASLSYEEWKASEKSNKKMHIPAGGILTNSLFRPKAGPLYHPADSYDDMLCLNKYNVIKAISTRDIIKLMEVWYVTSNTGSNTSI